MIDTLGENQAVPAAVQRGTDVGHDGLVALLVGGQASHEGGIAGTLVEAGIGQALMGHDLQDEWSARAAHRVADRAALHGDERMQPVLSARGGGEAQPATDGGVAQRLLVGAGGHVVTLVDDHQSVALE
ncbi:MAG: hypothetical protein ACYCZV_15220 [Acidimicrobiales bacterium]